MNMNLFIQSGLARRADRHLSARRHSAAIAAIMLALAWSPLLTAGDAATPHLCCAPAVEKTCCAKPAEETANAPIRDRSIYQLGATWTNDTNQSVTLAHLRGRPVVLAMFFASCEYACPILVGDMQRIREALPADVRAAAQFVLVSFDDVRDTPAALRAYRERAQINDPAWTLLHGSPDDVQELAMLLGVKYKKDARGQFAHSNLITVLNAEGEIVHQRNGLHGEVAAAVSAVSLVAK